MGNIITTNLILLLIIITLLIIGISLHNNLAAIANQAKFSNQIKWQAYKTHIGKKANSKQAPIPKWQPEA